MALIINNEAIECVNNGTDTPAFLKDDDGVNIIHLKYVHTDAWRGYYKAVATKRGGWKKIDYDGWMTGNWDDAPEEARESTVEDNLQKLGESYSQLGQDVLVVFTPTSNVFSTSFDVFVK